MPIIASDFGVAFSNHGIDAAFEFLSPSVHHLYLVAPEKEFAKAQDWPGYKETMARHEGLISWVFEETFDINPGGFHYKNVYQQMLKFHIFHTIPTLLDDTVIVDADVRFVKPRQIMLGCNRTGVYVTKPAGQKKGNPSWNGKTFFETLAPSLNLTRPGDLNSNHVAHHMLFQRDVMLHLHETVAKADGEDRFVEAVYKWHNARVTEYDFYASWVEVFWPERWHEVKLPYSDSSHCGDERAKAQEATDIIYLACHDHRLGPIESRWMGVQNSKFPAYCWLHPETGKPMKCDMRSRGERFGTNKKKHGRRLSQQESHVINLSGHGFGERMSNVFPI